VNATFLFFAGIIITITGLASPPMALAIGIAYGILFTNPFHRQSTEWSKRLLQFSVVMLGFGMNAAEVLRTGRASFWPTVLEISMVMGIGLLLGFVLKINKKAAFLITVGTAICGGSAIAAVAPATNPDEEELAVSLGTVFTLNALALLLFPAIGSGLHMTQTQFGLWSALAIHDTSSVVGAAARFGPQALAVGTVVKLTRALWIVPVTLVTALVYQSRAGVRMPWFIVWFGLAVLAGTWFHGETHYLHELSALGHTGLALTLFLIGTGITPRMIRKTGMRVMAQGAALWILAAAVSLLAILQGWIHL
jgi:uncharacterized integral membrane protein (TIGR00698 family)